MARALRVLITDDNERFGKAVARFLSDSPHVHVAGLVTSGEEALAAIDSCSPDVAVVDLQMPGIGGVETIRRMKALDPALRVVAITAHADSQPRAVALAAGADAYVAKPDTADLLLSAICGTRRWPPEAGHGRWAERAPPDP